MVPKVPINEGVEISRAITYIFLKGRALAQINNSVVTQMGRFCYMLLKKDKNSHLKSHFNRCRYRPIAGFGRGLVRDMFVPRPEIKRIIPNYGMTL